jgi:hypothetical protein
MFYCTQIEKHLQVKSSLVEDENEDEDEEEEEEEEEDIDDEEDDDDDDEDEVAEQEAVGIPSRTAPSRTLSSSSSSAAQLPPPAKRQRVSAPLPTSTPYAPPAQPSSLRTPATRSLLYGARPSPQPPQHAQHAGTWRPQPTAASEQHQHHQQPLPPVVPLAPSSMDLSRDPRIAPQHKLLASLVQRTQAPMGLPPPSSSSSSWSSGMHAPTPSRPYLYALQTTTTSGASVADPRLRQVKSEPRGEWSAMAAPSARTLLIEEPCCHVFLEGGTPHVYALLHAMMTTERSDNADVG